MSKCNVLLDREIKTKYHILAVENNISLGDLISKILEICYERKDIIQEAIKSLKCEER